MGCNARKTSKQTNKQTLFIVNWNARWNSEIYSFRVAIGVTTFVFSYVPSPHDTSLFLTTQNPYTEVKKRLNPFLIYYITNLITSSHLLYDTNFFIIWPLNNIRPITARYRICIYSAISESKKQMIISKGWNKSPDFIVKYIPKYSHIPTQRYR
jgi:hypothetical protein